MSTKTITLGNYTESIAPYAAELGHLNNDVHFTLGIIEETFETFDAFQNNDFQNVYEELGDIMWYVAMFCKNNNMSLKEHVEYVEINLEEYNEPLAFKKLLYHIKRTFAYNAEFAQIDRDIAIDNVIAMPLSLIAAINSMETAEQEITLLQILQTNYDKLEARYGVKFSEESAINRDTDNEAEVMKVSMSENQQ